MVLVDWEIIQALAEGRITITPLLNARRQIGSSSVDLRLGTEFRLIARSKQDHFRLTVSTEGLREQVRQYTEVIHVEPMKPFFLHPGEFALGCTLEYIKLPPTWQVPSMGAARGGVPDFRFIRPLARSLQVSKEL